MESVVDSLKRWFSYDPITGIITRLKANSWTVIGDIDTDQRCIGHNGIRYPYATLAWILYYGEIPNGLIDHQDRIHANHTIQNLRIATPTQNQYNKSGMGIYAKGVTWRDRKAKPWQAKIRVDGLRIHLGSFATEAEAAQAYQEACIKYHGEFACPT